MEKLNVVELYCGTARSWEPFRQWRRCQLALLVDKNDYAAATYSANFPKAPYRVRDLSRVGASEIQDLAGGRVDILLGCPPCQGFSETGNRDRNDPRNAHLARYAAIAVGLRPMVIAMENVPAVVETTQYADFVRALMAAGYAYTAGILNAAVWGSPQCRHRLILVAARGDLRVQPGFPAQTSHGATGRYYNYSTGRIEPLSAHPGSMLAIGPATQRNSPLTSYQETSHGARAIPTVADALCDLPALGTPAAQALGHKQWNHTPKMLRRMRSVPEGGRWRGGDDHFSHAYGRLHRRGLARTITTFFSNPGSGRFWHPTENRALTLREAARIQGFPDDFRFLPRHPSTAAVLVGNALDSCLARITYSVIRRCLD